MTSKALPSIKKKRKINKAWNSYIEPRRSEIEAVQAHRRYEIGEIMQKKFR